MVQYSDTNILLREYNLIGEGVGSAGNAIGIVPNQHVIPNVTNGVTEYTVSYSFLRTADDIVDSVYYDDPFFYTATTSPKAYMPLNDYNGNIDSAIVSILSSTGNNNDYRSLFSDVANVNFELNTTSIGAITFGQLKGIPSNFFSDASKSAFSFQYTPPIPPATGTLPELAHSQLKHGDVWINLDHNAVVNGLGSYNIWEESGSIAPGTSGYTVLLEEISHSLGVDIIETGPNAPFKAELNNHKYTITARNVHQDLDFNVDRFLSTETIGEVLDVVEASGNPYPTGLQLFDISALQEIYGRNYTKRAENTVYNKKGAFASDADNGAFAYTIWDGGGYDTIDVSGFNYGAQVDLRQGNFSSIGDRGNGTPVIWDTHSNGVTIYDAGNVAIAYFTVIEKAIGTSENDILIGNAWNNVLEGGAGNDNLYGDGAVYVDGEVGFTENGTLRNDNKWVPANKNGSGDDILDGGADNDGLYKEIGDKKVVLNNRGAHYPNFVMFKDINNPKTVKRVDYQELDKVFGKNVFLKEAYIQMTDEPVTWGKVDNYMPKFDGTFYSIGRDKFKRGKK